MNKDKMKLKEAIKICEDFINEKKADQLYCTQL